MLGIICFQGFQGGGGGVLTTPDAKENDQGGVESPPVRANVLEEDDKVDTQVAPQGNPQEEAKGEEPLKCGGQGREKAKEGGKDHRPNEALPPPVFVPNPAPKDPPNQFSQKGDGGKEAQRQVTQFRPLFITGEMGMKGGEKRNENGSIIETSSLSSGIINDARMSSMVPAAYPNPQRKRRWI